MPELPADFHFLRPAWLWLFAAAVLVPLFVWRRDRRALPGAPAIAPHLLKHLTVPRGTTWWLRPSHLAALVLALGAIGLAGPAWEREPTPFTEDLAPLVIAIDLSTSMNAIDAAPTRLERAKQKVHDLLALRSGARTALVVYAGTAHTVLPPTDDPGVVGLYLDALATDLMPRQGKDASAALEVAARILERDEVPGSVLFLTDGIPRAQVKAFAEFARGDAGLMVLGIGTSEGGPIRTGENRFLTEGGRRVVAKLDKDGLAALARETGGYVGTVTVDDTDVKRLQRRTQSHLQSVRERHATARWKDAGYFVVYPIALLALLWFRRGWTVNWAAVWLLALLWPLPAHAQGSGGSGGFRFVDLWLTRDQQGRAAFDRGDYAAAAERFVDPRWKGVACYRAGDIECAIDQFARLDTAESNYNLGNAYVRLKQWPEAVQAYDRALRLQAGMVEARENRDLVLDVIRRIEEARKKPPAEKEQEEQAPDLGADEVKFDKEAGKGKEARIDRKLLQDAMAEKWLRALRTTPEEFLRMKFAIQAEAAAPPGAAPRRPGSEGDKR